VSWSIFLLINKIFINKDNRDNSLGTWFVFVGIISIVVWILIKVISFLDFHYIQ